MTSRHRPSRALRITLAIVAVVLLALTGVATWIGVSVVRAPLNTTATCSATRTRA
ncbi:hypothetical protein [Gordonia iterans]